MRSKDTRRNSVALSASAEGSIASFSRRQMNLSSGWRPNPRFTAGKGCGTGATKAQ